MSKSRILLTGAYGFVGKCIGPLLAEQFELLKAPAYDLDSGQGLDLSDEDAAKQLLQQTRPDVVVHLAAIKNVGLCERKPELAEAANVATTANLLREGTGGPDMVFLSSDYVFDGKQGLYRDSDVVHPITVYGRTKRKAELLVLQAGGTVVRSGGLYGPAEKPGALFSWAMNELRAGKKIEAYDNVYNTPTYVGDLGQVLLAMCRHRPGGVYHAAGAERLNRFELLKLLADQLGVSRELVQPGRCSSGSGNAITAGDLSLLCTNRWPMEAIRLRGVSQILAEWSAEPADSRSDTQAQLFPSR